jgi:signal transduction histidine kinase
MLAAGLFAIGTAEGSGRIWLGVGVAVGGLLVHVLRSIQVEPKVLAIVIVGVAFAAAIGGFLWVGFLAGPGIAVATTTVLAGALLGRRAVVAVVVLLCLCVAIIAYLVTHGYLPGPSSENLDPTRPIVWVRTMSVSLVILVLLSNGVLRVVDDMDAAIIRAESETHRRQRAERMRADAERKALDMRHLETIGRLASGVAHDFNNNLTAIIGMAELLKVDVPEDTPQREMIEHILSASVRSADLTKQLLAYSRKARVQPVPTEVDALAAGSVELVRRSMHPNIAVVVDLDAKGVSVSADPALLQSAIMNLLINARDAMPNGGRLTLRSRLERSGDPSTETPEAGAKVLLEVSDTGHGMTSEVRARAFDPFFTTKPPRNRRWGRTSHRDFFH